MPIVWDGSRLSTGVPEVDSQHREWIRLYNSFHAALQERRGKDVVQGTLRSMLDYTLVHFRHEEACMMRLKCPAALMNKHAHEKLVEAITSIQKRLEGRQATSVDALEIDDLLGRWIEGHIIGVDCGLRACAPRS